MNALERPIGFPFGATSLPYSPAHPHPGDDYSAVFDPLIIGTTLVAKTGNSGSYQGVTYDPHCHVQAGHDEWAQKSIDPRPFTGKPGLVVKTGYASEWGNYVCIRVGSVNVFYCHLSEIYVKQGDIIVDNTVSISKEEYEDLKTWKMIGQDALPWKNAVVASSLMPLLGGDASAIPKAVEDLVQGGLSRARVLTYINNKLS